MSLRTLSLVLLLGLAAGCATVQPGLDSPEAVTKLLEQRWPPERIKEFCRPDTRWVPGRPNPFPSYQSTALWEGQLHRRLERELGNVHWYGGANSNGILDLSLSVSREDGDWVLVFEDAGSLRRPTSVPSYSNQVIYRVVYALFHTVSFQYDYAQTSLIWDDYENLPDELERLESLIHDDDGTVCSLEFDKASIKPVKFKLTGSNATLVVEFDDRVNPARFLINGAPSTAIGQFYQDWITERDNHSRQRVDADKMQSITDARIEFAGRNDDAFPRDWTVLNDEDRIERDDFLQEGSNKKPGRMRDVMTWTDFVYFPGHKLTDPDDTIIAGSPPKNYQGRKALVATLGGDVKIISPAEYEALRLKSP